jgi:hypothetical protein
MYIFLSTRLYNPYGSVYGRASSGGGGATHYDTPTHYESHGPPASLDVSPEINFEDTKQVGYPTGTFI